MAPPRRTRPLLPPPYKRPNWSRLNNGQKRYAMEQYNLALVRRGKYFKPPIVSETSRREETGQPGTTESTGNENDRNANEDSDDEVGGPIQVQADVHRSDEPISEQNTNRDDIEDLLRPSSTATTINDEEEQEYIDNFEFASIPQPFSDLEQRYIDDFDMSAMDVSSSSSGKRAAADPIVAGGKKKMPGTGENNAENQRQMGGDAMAETGPIERPLSNRTDMFSRTYRKVHRFLTFGLAYNPIETAHSRGGTLTDSFMITPLAEIPWDRLFMYMNPSEYSLLPNGARVVSLHIKITQRNVRVAFQTNSSATALATLNQNKNVIYADGLRQYSNGCNAYPTTFTANEPMIVSALVPDIGLDTDYNTHVRQFYGVQNNETGFATGVPRHQFGKPYILPFYYADINFTSEPQLSGWSCFQERYHEFNADTTSCSTFIERSYKPKMGLIKAPYDSITGGWPRYSGAAGDITIATGGGIEPNKQKTIHYNGTNSVLEATRQMTQVGSTELNAATDNYFSGYVNYQVAPVAGTFPTNETVPMAITQLIEKDQLFRSGNENSRASSQPSLHIGVQPVPAISTTGFSVTYDDSSFTDVQCYWEAVCTATVVSGYPTRKPLAFVGNVEPNELMWRMQNNAGATYTLHPELSMREGLYITNADTAT